MQAFFRESVSLAEFLYHRFHAAKILYFFALPFRSNINSEYEECGEQFCQGSCQPDARIAGEQRKHEEAGCQQDKSPQKGDDSGISRTFYTLEIPDGNNIDGKEDEARSIQGESFTGNFIGRVAAVDEHGNNFLTEQNRYQCEYDTADDCRFQCQQIGMADAGFLMEPVVITDDGLRRLCNGIVYHKYNREEVARNAECRHTLFFQITYEHDVADKHHAGNSYFA